MPIAGIIAAFVGVVAVVAFTIASVYVTVKGLGLLGRVIAFEVSQIVGIITDTFRAIGALVVAVIVAPLIVANVVIGRWSAAAHFGRTLTGELSACVACLYRVAIGRPLRIIGLGPVLEGVEGRLPAAIAGAPGRDAPTIRLGGKDGKTPIGMFDGYTVVGSLKGGGSGGKLYIAEPTPEKTAALAKRGHTRVDRVVIKSFRLDDGSSLPQIVRESRALDSAKKLGLVLEHDLGSERFFYVMHYVPGESLSSITRRLHAESPAEGLDDARMKLAIGYLVDLLEVLGRYHRGGLWHKDVKPDNIIVDAEKDPAVDRGRAHLVDFGLVTPLRSSMTLTTHGTEYFRDPELVKQALRGAKVSEIDGARFDVYAAGAVLFSVIENSFPAHGGLSRVTKSCPEPLRWIVRRAMTDYDKRYATADAMKRDLLALLAAPSVAAVKPGELPSVRGGEDLPEEPVQAPVEEATIVNDVRAATPVASVMDRGVRTAGANGRGGRPSRDSVRVVAERRSAKEQLASARARVSKRRAGALSRAGSHEGRAAIGVAVALVGFLGLVVGGAGYMLLTPSMGGSSVSSTTTLPAPAGVATPATSRPPLLPTVTQGHAIAFPTLERSVVGAGLLIVPRPGGKLDAPAVLAATDLFEAAGGVWVNDPAGPSVPDRELEKAIGDVRFVTTPQISPGLDDRVKSLTAVVSQYAWLDAIVWIESGSGDEQTTLAATANDGGHASLGDAGVLIAVESLLLGGEPEWADFPEPTLFPGDATSGFGAIRRSPSPGVN